MAWIQALWAFVAFVGIAAGWNIASRWLSRGDAAKSADLKHLQQRIDALWADASVKEHAIKTLEEADKQHDKALLAVSNKVEGAAAAAASRWRK